MGDKPRHADDLAVSTWRYVVNREQRSGWLLGLMFLALVFTVGFGLYYVNLRVAESEQRDCESLLADITAIEEGGKLTESGSRVTLSRRVRYAEIGCAPELPAPAYVIITPTPGN